MKTKKGSNVVHLGEPTENLGILLYLQLLIDTLIS